MTYAPKKNETEKRIPKAQWEYFKDTAGNKEE